MEFAATATAVAGPSSEVSTPGAYEEDGRHSHFALSLANTPKPIGYVLPLAGSSQSHEMLVKEARSTGMRFQEDGHDTDLPSPRLRSSRLFKGKGKDALPAEREKKKPLCLLDLPVDVLKDIVKEVTHTNDLTSLALCHSALHQLAIPHIYSRFDIVWPERETTSEARSGVDALTYGLATLVMAEEIFGESPAQRRDHANRYNKRGHGLATDMTIRRRRGNHYAQYTKKFSLGNGPKDWVQEYLITKEGGKMLGTLVALAVARMRSLETFVWDMPTGILRDVWLALSSLGDRDDEKPCRLEKVWVRWHDNISEQTTNPIPPIPSQTDMPSMPPPLQTNDARVPQLHQPTALDRVEHPSFSVLPALRSLSVLDIDELTYLDEMAVLIGTSLDKLRELRVGIARHAVSRDWVTVWEGDTLQQVDPEYPTAGCVTIGEKRLGGVLGTLTGFIHDIRKPRTVLPVRTCQKWTSISSQNSPADEPAAQRDAGTVDGNVDPTGLTSLRDVVTEPPANEAQPASPYTLSSPISEDAMFGDAAATEADAAIASALSVITSQSPAMFNTTDIMEEAIEIIEETFEILDPGNAPSPSPVPEQTTHLNHVLQLENLELERVPLSVPVLQKAIDWTKLTSLTLLHCPNHEQLWKTLRRQFAPIPASPTYPSPRRSSLLTPKKELEHPLKLKKVHTNTVSPSLILFLKETLAPNSLQTLFLQEARTYTSTVQIDAIVRGPLRRHRGSLEKLLIDSSEKLSDGSPAHSSKWRKWMLTRDALSFICSGKMPALRELGVVLDHREWHYFLQHLPSIPHLRSIYLPFIADPPHSMTADAFPRELGEQIVDIVALRPEVELCYMGIGTKCFEILENRKDSDCRSDLLVQGGPIPTIDDEEEEEEEEEEDMEDLDDDDENDDQEENDTESDEDDDDDVDDSDSEADGISSANEDRGAGRVRLREILFYDDKVAVFKARHGRL